jgi:uncharacterized membrane protein YsdA (DUF1294 family)
MTLTQLTSLAAYASGSSAILALIAIGLFFAGVKPFGPINDTLLGLMALLMIPIAIGFNQLQSPSALRTIAMIVGILAMLTFVIHQVLLVTGKVKITNYDRITEPTLAIFNISMGFIGLWLAAVNFFARDTSLLPTGLLVVGYLAASGFALMPVAYWRGGMKHPLTFITGFLWQLGFPIWAIWLGSVLSAR